MKREREASMPYIKRSRRVDFEAALADLELRQIESPGELNYLVSMLCKMYGKLKDFNYQAINDIIGALECAKHEYIRRNVDGYEDCAIRRNGDLD